MPILAARAAKAARGSAARERAADAARSLTGFGKAAAAANIMQLQAATRTLKNANLHKLHYSISGSRKSRTTELWQAQFP